MNYELSWSNEILWAFSHERSIEHRVEWGKVITQTHITALAKRRGRFELSFLEICLILLKTFQLMDPWVLSVHYPGKVVSGSAIYHMVVASLAHKWWLSVKRNSHLELRVKILVGWVEIEMSWECIVYFRYRLWFIELSICLYDIELSIYLYDLSWVFTYMIWVE